MATELEELQALNTAFAEFVTYQKGQDVAAATAAAEEKAADVLADEAAAAALVAAQTSENDFRASVLLAISEIDTGGAAPTVSTDYTNLLTSIETAVKPDADRSAVEYYADLSLIVFLGGIVPIFITVIVINWIFQMLRRAF